MRWMTKLDRALCDMAVRAARTGGDEARRVREVVAGVLRLDPQRLTSFFHVGFSEVLLGLESSELLSPPVNEARDRWYAFGKLVGLAREHRYEEAAALGSAEVALRMARDAQIGPEAVPLAVDALLRVDALTQAVELAWAFIRPEKPEEAAFFRQVVRDALDRLPLFRGPAPNAPDAVAEAARRAASPEDSETFLRHLADKESWQTALGPLRALVLHGLGRAAALRGAFDDAERLQLRAENSFEPDDPLRPVASAHRALALLQMRSPGELRPGRAVRPNGDRAHEVLLRAAGPAVARPSVTALYALGVLELEAGRTAEADALFAKATERLLESPPADAAPVEPWVKFQRAQSLFRIRPAPSAEDLRTAGGLMREALEHVRPDAEELRRAADSLEGLGDARRRDILVRIVLEDVASVDALVRLAADLLEVDEPERALKAAERALVLAARPDHRLQAQRVQVRALCGQGRVDEAGDVYERLREHCLERGMLRELARFVEGEGRECGLVLPRERLLVLNHVGRMNPAALPSPGPAREDLLTELVRLYLGSHEDEDLASADELIHELRALAKTPAAADELGARLAAQSANRGVPVVPPPIPDLALHVMHRFGGVLGLLIVGGAERDRERFERFAVRGSEIGYRASWVPAYYDDPSRTLAEAEAAMAADCRGLLLLRWNRRLVREGLAGRAQQQGALMRRFDLHGFHGLAVQARLLLAQLVQRHALTGH
jgi:tetratricopeptide (TPR) repeat protein